MKTIRKVRVYEHDINDVWAAITDAHALAEWLMPNDFKPVVGHRFTFQADPHPACRNIRTEGLVLEVDRPRRVAWESADVMPDGSRQVTKVVWTLEPITTKRGTPGTRLIFEHQHVENLGFFHRLMLRMGWGVMLRKLIPRILKGVSRGVFTPGVIPLNKRYYTVKTVPPHLVR